MSTNPMTQERLDAIRGRAESVTTLQSASFNDWQELALDLSECVDDLLAEVERLRAQLTVDDAMVERMAEAIYLRCFLRCNTWATEARAKASLKTAKAGYIGYIDGWKAACEDARAALEALDALDAVVSAPEHAHQTKEQEERISTNKQCVCNIGAQHCFVHNRQTRTQEEKIAFRLAWDARVDATKHAHQTKEHTS